MPSYIILANWTAKGIETVKESPNRLENAKAAFEQAGAKIKAFYLVMGEYDMVLIGEAPNDETAAVLALAIGSGGMVRTKTLRVFTEDEYKNIISNLP